MNYNIDMNKVVSFIETNLNKNIKEIYDDELLQITTLPLFYIKNGNEENAFDINYICSTFQNLKKIIFNNFHITSEFMNELGFLDLECIEFNNCNIEEFNYKSNLNKIIIKKSIVNNFDFLRNFSKLESFEYFDCNDSIFDLNFLNENYELKFLRINNCKIINSGFNNINEKINIVNFINSSLDQDVINYIEKLSCLTRLFINKDYSNNIKLNEDVVVETNLRSLLVDLEVDLRAD